MRKRKSSILLPLALGGALLGAYFFLMAHPMRVAGLGDIPQQIFGTQLRGLKFIAIAIIIIGIVRALDRVIFDVFAARRRTVNAPHLLREIFSILLYFVLFGWAGALVFENFSVAGFLATGSVLAVVLGFALQDTLGNLFAGIALHMEDSFTIGDVIRSGEFIGVVEGIRWRGTRLRTFSNTVVTLPNSVIARERLEIFPRGNANARVLTVSAPYDVPPERVIGILQRAAMNVPGVAHDPPSLARLGAFAESGVTYEIKYWMHDYSMRDTIDTEIRQAAWYAFRRNGISFPYPVRALERHQAPKRNDYTLTRQQVLDLLERTRVLAPLGAEARGVLADAALVGVYGRGDTIIRRGDAGSSMFIVHSGTVAIGIPDAADDDVKQIAEIGPGGFFGEMALLTGQKRSADAIARSTVVAVEITKAAFEPILHEYPELAASISAEVEERNDDLAAFRASMTPEGDKPLLTRIREYFGVR